MNLELLNKEMKSLLDDLSSGLGDFGLFFHASKLHKKGAIEDELEQIFGEELRRRRANEIEYIYSDPQKSPELLHKAIKKWIEISGVEDSWNRKVISAYNNIVKHESNSIYYTKVRGCSYKKKGLNDPVNFRLYYDYFIVKRADDTYIFEVGGDD
ncbi:MAG: hypothetical protein ACRBHB_04315 [Arenicella sp.]